MSKIKRIAFSIGDPGGIGPEVTFKAIRNTFQVNSYTPIIYGSANLLAHEKWQLFVSGLPLTVIQPNDEIQDQKINFLDCGDYEGDLLLKSDQQNGQQSFNYLCRSVDACKEKRVDALVTAPICKYSFTLAGINYTGHTTLLSALTSSRTVSMAFYTERLKTVLATVHMPLQKVSSELNEPLLNKTFKNSLLFAKQLQIVNPKIALAALNPHASEGGMFGNEERVLLEPLVRKWQSQGHAVFGPIPADTLYHRAYKGEFDIVISLYHDQGLIPIKLLNFHDAVNVTLGLPFIRTSPDHGTAFDIAYQDKADASSMISATQLALKLS